MSPNDIEKIMVLSISKCDISFGYRHLSSINALGVVVLKFEPTPYFVPKFDILDIYTTNTIAVTVLVCYQTLL